MRWVSLLIFCLSLNPLTAQRKTYSHILQHSTEINSIALTDTLFDDLESLGKAIGDSRIVLLGEQNHGDAAAFEAKSRIIRYLHEKKGFHVLVFESDFYGLCRAGDDFLFQDSSVQVIKKNLYGIWSNCQPISPFFAYLNQARGENKLHIAGMDTRHCLSYSKKHFVAEFRQRFKAFKVSSEDSSNFELCLAILTELINHEYKSTAKPADQDRFMLFLNRLLAEYKENDFWQQELNNLLSFANNSWALGKPEWSRDKLMAQNLLWLYRNKYPGEKLIVWAHNGHIARDMESFRTAQGVALFPGYMPNMGDLLFKELQDTLYSIGFVAYQGYSHFAGYDSSAYFKPYKGKNYEGIMASKGFAYAFTNLQALPAKSSFTVRGITHHFPIKKEWNRTYDGLFFIREMYGCETIEYDSK